MSNESYDDGGDNAVDGNKTAPDNSADNPSVSTEDDVAKDQFDMQTDNSDTADLTGVSEGIQGTVLSDDEYEYEGEDIEIFGQLFKSLEPAVGQNVRRSSRKSSMPSKYSGYILNKNVKYGIDKVVNYTHLGMENFVFATSLNKIFRNHLLMLMLSKTVDE
ncbi:hypothetical protein Tco_0247598 [Tanacetum coccineum]